MQLNSIEVSKMHYDRPAWLASLAYYPKAYRFDFRECPRRIVSPLLIGWICIMFPPQRDQLPYLSDRNSEYCPFKLSKGKGAIALEH